MEYNGQFVVSYSVQELGRDNSEAAGSSWSTTGRRCFSTGTAGSSRGGRPDNSGKQVGGSLRLNLPTGRHKFTLRAWDAVGNVDEYSFETSAGETGESGLYTPPVVTVLVVVVVLRRREET